MHGLHCANNFFCVLLITLVKITLWQHIIASTPFITVDQYQANLNVTVECCEAVGILLVLRALPDYPS